MSKLSHSTCITVCCMGFEFEVVTEQTEREELVGRIMGWLYGSRVYLPLVTKSYP